MPVTWGLAPWQSNIGAVLCDNLGQKWLMLLNCTGGAAMLRVMTRIPFLRLVLAGPLVALLLAQPAFANCYADYKAKREHPLRLHYGVIELQNGACASPAAARSAISARIAKEGWTLLAVLSIFGPEGLAQRKESAGAFYLRY